MPAHRDPVVWELGPAIGETDPAWLCAQLRALVAGHAGITVVGDLAGLTATGLPVVDVLARLQLTARRLGCRLVLAHAGAELRELLALTSLDRVLPLADELGLR